MFILISGGSGLVGTHLCRKLKQKGYAVGILSRTKKTRPDILVYHWNPEKKEIEAEAIERADYIVHLSGENILEKRWTQKQKQKIIDSRIKTAEFLFGKVKESNKDLKGFISASAIGYYGVVTTEKIFTEIDPPGKDFPAKVCVIWEKAADMFNDHAERVVKIRTSPVLAREGGALIPLLVQTRIGIGAAIGTGKQYFPWIHIDDLCNIYIKAIEDEKMNGAYNAAAPDHRTNEEFMRTLTTIMDKPFWFPNIPAFAMKLILGERGETALKGSRILSDKIQEAGFIFEYYTLEKALANLLFKEQP